MKLLRVTNDSRGRGLADRCLVADGFWTRLRGLLGRPPLGTGEGLLITPCRGVHMVGMKYPIDVVFIDRAGAVVGLAAGLAPWRRSGWHRDARHALELPAGTIDSTGTRIRDRISMEPAETDRQSDPGSGVAGATLEGE